MSGLMLYTEDSGGGGGGGGGEPTPPPQNDPCAGKKGALDYGRVNNRGEMASQHIMNRHIRPNTDPTASRTLNNPLKFIDPTGKEIELSGQEAQAFVDYLEKKTGLKLKYKVKNGVIRITGSSRDKNFTGTVNEKLRDVVKSAASAAEVAKYEVGKNLTNANGNDVFVDDNGDSWNAPRTKDGQLRTSMVDMADINQLDAGATEFAQALVGHFLEEGIEMRKPGANYENTGTPGAHEKGLKVEAEILSAATGAKQDTRYVPPGQGQTSTTFNFVYTTVQYDITFKSTGVTVVKTVPPSVQRPKKQK